MTEYRFLAAYRSPSRLAHTSATSQVCPHRSDLCQMHIPVRTNVGMAPMRCPDRPSHKGWWIPSRSEIDLETRLDHIQNHQDVHNTSMSCIDHFYVESLSWCRPAVIVRHFDLRCTVHGLLTPDPGQGFPFNNSRAHSLHDALD